MGDAQTNLTLRQRRRLQPSDSSSEPTSKRRYLWALLAIGLLAPVGAGAWALLYLIRGTDPRLAEIASLQADILKLDNPAMGKERQVLFKQLREKTDALPEDLKAQAEQAEQKNFPRMFQRGMDKFFAMSHEEQLAMLDTIIAGMKAREVAQKAADAAGNQLGKQLRQAAGALGGSDAQRTQHMQSMLSNIPPEQKERQFNLFRQMLTARMQQQGVSGSGGFGGGFF